MGDSDWIYPANRCLQLNILIEGYFYRQKIKFEATLVDGEKCKYLLSPGHLYEVTGIGSFYVTTRGYLASLHNGYAIDITDMIEDELLLNGKKFMTRISRNDDIIAFERDTSQETLKIIDDVLEICNSAALPDIPDDTTNRKAAEQGQAETQHRLNQHHGGGSNYSAIKRGPTIAAIIGGSLALIWGLVLLFVL